MEICDSGSAWLSNVSGKISSSIEIRGGMSCELKWRYKGQTNFMYKISERILNNHLNKIYVYFFERSQQNYLQRKFMVF